MSKATKQKGVREIAVEIEWRARSGAEFLPAKDTRWTRFCTLFEEVRSKKPNSAAAVMVVKSLNENRSNQQFEFRAGKEQLA